MTPNDPQAGLQSMLDAAAKGSRGSVRRRVAVAALAVLALAAAAAWLLTRNGGTTGRYVTEPAATGSLVVTVSASGTLQPTKSVDVGSELSGIIAEVRVQENDRVRRGDLLAQLDPAKLRDAVTKSRAALAAARASVEQARASVAETKAALARMRQVAELSGGKVPSKTELESAEAAALRAAATEASAHAAVDQAEALLKTDETNLGKGSIRSPVDGVVLTRKVEPGQSVVAAMQVPVLFTIAEDLSKMELQVKVDEADVGSVALGQPASFTVSAWPGREFPAKILRVGLGSTITENVVTYKTVLEVGNADLALRPGMTATASIVTARRDDALLVPNAALRFVPPAASPQANRSLVSSLLPRAPAGPPRRNGAQARGEQRVWVLEGDTPKPVAVTTGVTNGRQTEITGGELKAGMAVVTDYREAKQ